MNITKLKLFWISSEERPGFPYNRLIEQGHEYDPGRQVINEVVTLVCHRWNLKRRQIGSSYIYALKQVFILLYT